MIRPVLLSLVALLIVGLLLPPRPAAALSAPLPGLDPDVRALAASAADDEDQWSGTVTYEVTYQESLDQQDGFVRYVRNRRTYEKQSWKVVPGTTYRLPRPGSPELVPYYAATDWSLTYEEEYFSEKQSLDGECPGNAGYGITRSGASATGSGRSSIFISSIDGEETFDVHPGSSDKPRERLEASGTESGQYTECTGLGFTFGDPIKKPELGPNILNVRFDEKSPNVLRGSKTETTNDSFDGGSSTFTTTITWDLAKLGCSTTSFSGAHWRKQFPDSKSTADLTPSFGAAVDRFLAALKQGGARVKINSTFRPAERAYLMHYAWRIARENLDPRKVPKMPGVNICWVHKTASGTPDLNASRKAAQDMVKAYRIVFRPALDSRHTQRRAIDVSISWTGTLTVTNASGKRVKITSEPRTGAGNRDLWKVGRGYGVRKHPTDPPHWSDDGR